jgi:hypothetical protein
VAAETKAPTLTCPADPSTTGAYRLSWQGPGGGEFQLEERGEAGDFEILYSGPDVASTVTGRGEGEYTYRVGAVAGEGVIAYSEPCVVAVEPPSLGLALALFAVGLAVTGSTVALILRGHAAHRRGEIG